MIPQGYFDKVKSYFNGDEKKTWDWWRTANPLFGMFSPIDMIKLGREHRVKRVIDQQLQGLHP